MEEEVVEVLHHWVGVGVEIHNHQREAEEAEVQLFRQGEVVEQLRAVEFAGCVRVELEAVGLGLMGGPLEVVGGQGHLELGGDCEMEGQGHLVSSFLL